MRVQDADFFCGDVTVETVDKNSEQKNTKSTSVIGLLYNI